MKTQNYQKFDNPLEIKPSGKKKFKSKGFDISIKNVAKTNSQLSQRDKEFYEHKKIR